jgi:Putative zinc-finger
MNKHMDDLLPFYINATLPADQSEAVEAHLAGCIQCRKALMEWEDLAGWVRSATTLPGQAGPTVRLPALSPVVQANLHGKPSFPEAVLSTARLIAAQRIFLKESRLIHILSAVLLASVLADLFLPVKYQPTSPLPFFILVPFLAVLGISFFETREDGSSREIVAASPTHPAVLIFARLTLALGLIASLALIGSLLISVFGRISMGWLVLAWLGPMLWLPALATLLALLLNSWAAAGISVTLWGGIALLLATQGFGQSLLGFSLAPLLYPNWWSFGLQMLLGGILWLICWLWLFLGAPPALRLERSG